MSQIYIVIVADDNLFTPKYKYEFTLSSYQETTTCHRYYRTITVYIISYYGILNDPTVFFSHKVFINKKSVGRKISCSTLLCALHLARIAHVNILYGLLNTDLID